MQRHTLSRRALLSSVAVLYATPTRAQPPGPLAFDYPVLLPDMSIRRYAGVCGRQSIDLGANTTLPLSEIYLRVEFPQPEPSTGELVSRDP